MKEPATLREPEEPPRSPWTVFFRAVKRPLLAVERPVCSPGRPSSILWRHAETRSRIGSGSSLRCWKREISRCDFFCASDARSRNSKLSADGAAAASSPVHRRAPGKSDEVGYVAWGGERWHATVRPPVAGGAPVLHAAKAGESVRPTELLLYERHGQRWQAQWLHGFFVSVPSGGAAAGGGGAGAPRPTIGRTLRYEDWGGEAKVWRPEAGAEAKAAG